MNTRRALREELNKLAKLPYIASKRVQTLKQRAEDTRPLTRDEGESDHFCTIFIPIVHSTARVFIGHHIKSGLWIPPGGHIDKGETPQETAVRECKEELATTINGADLTLIDCSYAPIMNRPNCSRHLDLWYALTCLRELPFDYDRGEFHEAGWCNIEEAIRLCTREAYQHVFVHLAQQIDSSSNAL
jgi:8-oxo-dGTP pyrophosphatase MutT (NUDIX family)